METENEILRATSMVAASAGSPADAAPTTTGLLAAGATWDIMMKHDLVKRGLVNIMQVSERLRPQAKCDGQGPVFEESAILEAIELSAAENSDELI